MNDLKVVYRTAYFPMRQHHQVHKRWVSCSAATTSYGNKSTNHRFWLMNGRKRSTKIQALF